MAALGNRKRKQNVRSSSSCSSTGSNENGVETGYISDNSNSDMEIASRRRESGGKFGARGKVDWSPPQCNVLKKEFVLNIDRRNKDSDEGDCYQPSRKRSKCLSKNALMARANREKKKQYLENLEKRVNDLQNENAELQEQVKKNDELVQRQNEEIKYLKSVLANSREISMLLKSVRQNTGLPVTSSVNKFADPQIFKESAFDSDIPDSLFSYGDWRSLTPELPETDLLEQQVADKPVESFEGNSLLNVGICLHVAQQKVSLEFCSTCSNNASSSWQENTG